MVSNFWVFPRGMIRNGEAGERSFEWTSKYGSLAVSSYDISTVDGINEEGLNPSLLWLNAITFPKDDNLTPRMSLSLWAQFYAVVLKIVLCGQVFMSMRQRKRMISGLPPQRFLVLSAMLQYHMA